MVVLDESKENFIVHVPDSEEMDAKLRSHLTLQPNNGELGKIPGRIYSSFFKFYEYFPFITPDKCLRNVQLMEEERRRTGRYLAVTVILFIIALGLYHTVSRFASDASALVSAAMIMFLYLLWLWYSSQRRKLQLKRDELSIENQVTTALEILNNNKHVLLEKGSHENYIYSSSEDEADNKCVNSDVKLNNKNANARALKKHASVDDCGAKYGQGNLLFDESSNKGNEIFIRTYSVG